MLGVYKEVFGTQRKMERAVDVPTFVSDENDNGTRMDELMQSYASNEYMESDISELVKEFSDKKETLNEETRQNLKEEFLIFLVSKLQTKFDLKEWKFERDNLENKIDFDSNDLFTFDKEAISHDSMIAISKSFWITRNELIDRLNSNIEISEQKSEVEKLNKILDDVLQKLEMVIDQRDKLAQENENFQEINAELNEQILQSQEKLVLLRESISKLLVEAKVNKEQVVLLKAELDEKEAEIQSLQNQMSQKQEELNIVDLHDRSSSHQWENTWVDVREENSEPKTLEIVEPEISQTASQGDTLEVVYPEDIDNVTIQKEREQIIDLPIESQNITEKVPEYQRKAAVNAAIRKYRAWAEMYAPLKELYDSTIIVARKSTMQEIQTFVAEMNKIDKQFIALQQEKRDSETISKLKENTKTEIKNEKNAEGIEEEKDLEVWSFTGINGKEVTLIYNRETWSITADTSYFDGAMDFEIPDLKIDGNTDFVKQVAAYTQDFEEMYNRKVLENIESGNWKRMTIGKVHVDGTDHDIVLFREQSVFMDDTDETGKLLLKVETGFADWVSDREVTIEAPMNGDHIDIPALQQDVKKLQDLYRKKREDLLKKSSLHEQQNIDR